MFKTAKATRLTLLAILFSLLGSFQVASAVPSDDTTVFDKGKKKVHVAECKRYQKDTESEFTQMTYGEAKAKGKDLCSRCPGSPTPKE